jgi:hypothetical protein
VNSLTTTSGLFVTSDPDDIKGRVISTSGNNRLLKILNLGRKLLSNRQIKVVK